LKKLNPYITIILALFVALGTELFRISSICLISGSITLFIAILKKDKLGIIYSSRALFLIIIILLLIFRANY